MVVLMEMESFVHKDGSDSKKSILMVSAFLSL